MKNTLIATILLLSQVTFASDYLCFVFNGFGEPYGKFPVVVKTGAIGYFEDAGIPANFLCSVGENSNQIPFLSCSIMDKSKSGFQPSAMTEADSTLSMSTQVGDRFMALVCSLNPELENGNPSAKQMSEWFPQIQK